MQKQWMNRSILAISIGLAMVGAQVHAVDTDETTIGEVATGEVSTTPQQEGTTDPLAAQARAQTEAPITQDNDPATESAVVSTIADRPADTTPVTTPETP